MAHTHIRARVFTPWLSPPCFARCPVDQAEHDAVGEQEGEVAKPTAHEVREEVDVDAYAVRQTGRQRGGQGTSPAVGGGAHQLAPWAGGAHPRTRFQS
jgi:hypothetical protein